MSAMQKSTLTMLKSNFTNLCLNKYSCVFSLHKNVISFKKQNFHTSEVNCTVTAVAQKKREWNRVVADAEKIVGYSTSFLSIRWLLSNEIANMAEHFRRIMASNHPFLKTIKKLIYNGHNNIQAWGLVVLLVSKAAGHLSVNSAEEDPIAGILHSQRSIAEVTEMIRMGNLLHKGMLNINSSYSDPAMASELAFVNKVAILAGDHFLCNCCKELAALRNQPVIELISSALRDVSEAEFVGRRDSQNNPIPNVPPANCKGYAVKEWTVKNLLSSGSLVGKACQSTMKLAGHDIDTQEQAYKFGKHIALAWQAYLDLELFIEANPPLTFDLCAAPILFHIEHDPSILLEVEKGLESVENVDYNKIYEIVREGPGIEQTKELRKRHAIKAMDILSMFSESDAKTSLSHMIEATDRY